MWSNLPSDLLAIIFSFLPPHSLAHAMVACHHWHHCASCTPSVDTGRHQNHHHPPWFIALPTTSRSRASCFVHNPIESTWHSLNLAFIPSPAKPISTIGGLILFKSTGSSIPLQLSICNPFTSQFRHLPMLQNARTNPAVGVTVTDIWPNHFKVYVAGGMSEAASGGAASYDPTIEMFDSKSNKWEVMGSMPVEFAVRLTVWTPNESVYSRGVLYWMTSARSYSIMGLEMVTNKWKELSVPMADTLEFAALVPRNGKLTVVGGTQGGNASVWELGEGDQWNVIGRMPIEIGKRIACGNGSWGNTRCVGIEGAVCLYRESASDMVVWRKVEDNNGRWEWSWIEGCSSVRGLQNFPIKGMFLRPNLVHSSFI